MNNSLGRGGRSYLPSMKRWPRLALVHCRIGKPLLGMGRIASANGVRVQARPPQLLRLRSNAHISPALSMTPIDVIGH